MRSVAQLDHLPQLLGSKSSFSFGARARPRAPRSEALDHPGRTLMYGSRECDVASVR
jgi:hypothetical protein